MTLKLNKSQIEEFYDAGYVVLPGVFRAHLLETGKAVEATLYPRDLERAHRIRLGNALRGWIPVTR